MNNQNPAQVKSTPAVFQVQIVKITVFGKSLILFFVSKKCTSIILIWEQKCY